MEYWRFLRGPYSAHPGSNHKRPARKHTISPSKCFLLLLRYVSLLSFWPNIEITFNRMIPNWGLSAIAALEIQFIITIIRHPIGASEGWSIAVHDTRGDADYLWGWPPNTTSWLGLEAYPIIQAPDVEGCRSPPVSIPSNIPIIITKENWHSTTTVLGLD